MFGNVYCCKGLKESGIKITFVHHISTLRNKLLQQSCPRTTFPQDWPCLVTNVQSQGRSIMGQHRFRGGLRGQTLGELRSISVPSPGSSDPRNCSNPYLYSQRQMKIMITSALMLPNWGRTKEHFPLEYQKMKHWICGWETSALCSLKTLPALSMYILNTALG